MSPPSDSAQKRQLRSATKCFLFSINLITFIFGLVLFFLGLVLQTRHGQYFFSDSDDDGNEGGEQGSTPPSTSSTSSAFYDLSAWCTAMGVIVCIVSFLGLYGSVRESHCALLSFSVLLGLAILLECSLAVSAFALASEERLGASVARGMRAAAERYGVEGEEDVTRVWDILQTDFSCCGVDFPGNWAQTPWGRQQNLPDRLPDSCCSRVPMTSASRPQVCRLTPDSTAHRDGCLPALEASARRNAGALGAIAAVVALGQIVLVVAACHLLRQLERPKSCTPCY